MEITSVFVDAYHEWKVRSQYDTCIMHAYNYPIFSSEDISGLHKMVKQLEYSFFKNINFLIILNSYYVNYYYYY